MNDKFINSAVKVFLDYNLKIYRFYQFIINLVQIGTFILFPQMINKSKNIECDGAGPGHYDTPQAPRGAAFTISPEASVPSDREKSRNAENIPGREKNTDSRA